MNTLPQVIIDYIPSDLGVTREELLEEIHDNESYQYLYVKGCGYSKALLGTEISTSIYMDISEDRRAIFRLYALIPLSSSLFEEDVIERIKTSYIPAEYIFFEYIDSENL